MADVTVKPMFCKYSISAGISCRYVRNVGKSQCSAKARTAKPNTVDAKKYGKIAQYRFQMSAVASPTRVSHVGFLWSLLFRVKILSARKKPVTIKKNSTPT